MIPLTDLEKDVLVNGLYNNEYANAPDERICVWSNSIEYNCETATKKQVSGIISSLVKKGLIISDGTRNGATVTVTTEGMNIIKELIK